MICPEFQDRELSPSQILLIAKVLVTDDEKFKPGNLGNAQQIAIFKRTPAQPRGSVNLVPGQFVQSVDDPANGVSSVALQADGKVLIGGDFTSVNGASRNHIARA